MRHFLISDKFEFSVSRVPDARGRCCWRFSLYANNRGARGELVDICNLFLIIEAHAAARLNKLEYASRRRHSAIEVGMFLEDAAGWRRM